MKTAIMLIPGLSAAIGGALLRSCNTGLETELARYWCGAQTSALTAQAHAHCAGCAMLASGLVMMIAAVVVGSLPRRRVARERTQ